MDFATRDLKDEEGTKGLEAVFQVDLPPDALLEMLWSPDNFPRLFPEIREARVLRVSSPRRDSGQFRVVRARLRQMPPAATTRQITQR